MPMNSCRVITGNGIYSNVPTAAKAHAALPRNMGTTHTGTDQCRRYMTQARWVKKAEQGIREQAPRTQDGRAPLCQPILLSTPV